MLSILLFCLLFGLGNVFLDSVDVDYKWDVGFDWCLVFVWFVGEGLGSGRCGMVDLV